MSRDNKKARAACLKFHAYPNGPTMQMDCYLCRAPFQIAATRWIAEHTIPHWYTQDDSPKNVWPAHYLCTVKKDRKDKADIAKSKRIMERHYGVKPATMAGSRNSRYQVKMDGSVIDRRTGEVLKQGRWNRGRQ